MRILFVGAVQFSQHCLKAVVEQGGRVVAVLTLARQNAGRHSDYADLSGLASTYGLPVHHVRSINDASTINHIRMAEPDVIFVFGWSELIRKTVLEVPPKGCIGSHPALLPRNRGRHPLIWALVEGLTEGGLTFFYLDDGVDSGDILWQRSFVVSIEDDAFSLQEKVKALAIEGIREFLPQLESGTAPRIPQDHSQATYWRKRREKDGEIQWSAPTMVTYNLVRALARPYVGAHTYLSGEKMSIWRTMLPRTGLEADCVSCPPGTIFSQNEMGLEVRTGDGFLTVVDYSCRSGPLRVGMQLGL